MLGPIYALFVEKIGGDLLDASIAFGTFSIVAGIIAFIAGRYSDQMKESELIVAYGYAIMGIGFFCYTLVHSIWGLLLVQIIVGMGEALYVSTFDAVYSKHIETCQLGKVWGTWEAANYFAAAIGAIAGGMLVKYFGFNAMFVIMSILCDISAIYIFRLSRKVL